MPRQQESEQLPDTSSSLRRDPAAGTEQESTSPPVPGRHRPETPQSTHDRRQFTVFQVDEFVFQQATTRTTHWSVPWSDLMMTMFILFLIMFVYQTENKEVLVGAKTEVIGGETTGALEITPNNTSSIPYVPIKPGLPLITAGTIRKVVPVHIYDIDENTRFIQDTKNPMERIKKSIEPLSTAPQKATETPTVPEEVTPGSETELLSNTGNVEPRPDANSATSADERARTLREAIAETIARYNIGRFSSVDIISGADVRVTLSSDLFFTAGKADLSSKSIPSLQKIGAAIKNAPFMIDVIGHTDNQPIHSDRFPSNWELSVARASSVARFFIEETEMNPNQFVVSGYSSYRPLSPNTTMQNRAANRRVEVIITHKYPRQIMAKKNIL